MSFTDKDFKSINPVNQDNLVVVSIIIVNLMVSKVVIDMGSSTNLLYWKTFQRLEVSLDIVHPHTIPLLDFTGKRVETRGYMDWADCNRQGRLKESTIVLSRELEGSIISSHQGAYQASLPSG